MKVFVFGLFFVVVFSSSFVLCDDDDEESIDVEPRSYGKTCTSHPDCEKHEYCKYIYGWYKKYCKSLPRCKLWSQYRRYRRYRRTHGRYKCPRYTVCKRNMNVGYHGSSYGQCVRTGTCTTHMQCNQTTECCRSNSHASYAYCAKRPREGQTCCPKYACWRCAEGLECKRRYWEKYGKCQALPTTPRPTTARPTTIKPTTEIIKPTTEEGSGSGEYDRALLE